MGNKDDVMVWFFVGVGAYWARKRIREVRDG